MKSNPNIGGYFTPTDGNRLEFKSANEQKSSVLLMFYILFGLLILVEIVSFLNGRSSLFYQIFFGEDRGKYSVFLLPFILPVIWFFLPPTQVILDRSSGIVHYKKGKRGFDFPWDSIQFTHQWYPTKTGGATLFTLKAVPPFPEALKRWIEKKKRRPPPGQVYTFNLGSFDVKDPEHGAAIFEFLDTWMRSRESAEVLYESRVGSRFGN